jgi:hypothetical protein
MVATHNLAMEFMRRAALIGKGLTVDEIDSNAIRATEMLRTFVTQMEALGQCRDKGNSRERGETGRTKIR